MKLSVETKVAAAVAAGYVALTAGTIALGRSGDQAGGPNDYGLMNNPGVNTNMSQQGLNSASAGRANTEEGTQSFRECHFYDAEERHEAQKRKAEQTSHTKNSAEPRTTTGYQSMAPLLRVLNDEH